MTTRTAFRSAGHLALALAAATVVVAARPDPAAWAAASTQVRSALAAAGRSGAGPSVDDLAVLLAGGAVWALAAWVLLVLVAGRLAAAPGRLGALGQAVVRLTVPRVLRGLVTGGVAGGLLLGPATAALAVPVWPTSPAPAASSTAPTTPGPAWPTDPASAVPAAPPATTPPATTPPATTPSAPPSTSPPTTTPTPTRAALPATPAGAVVVAPGDSLWSVAARSLQQAGRPVSDAAVAAAWPRWYAANRVVVGPAPDLLHPGTTLVPPSSTADPTDGSTP